MDTLRLMIVDDREEICKEMSTAIELAVPSGIGPIQVVATAHDGYDAIEKVQSCNPELILMDLEMPNLGGLTASRQIKASHPDILILAFTIHDSPATQLAVRQANMDGLISKGASLLKIIEEIDRYRSNRKHSENSKK